MRAPRKQQQQQQQLQQRAGSLKTFVRVGKASDVPTPKDAMAKTPVRMTRSKSAALAGTEQQQKEQPAVVETPVATRKRKLAAEPPSLETKEEPSSPPKKSVRTDNVSTDAAAAAAAMGTPKTARAKKATTINKYFSPVKKHASADDVAAEPAAEKPEPAAEAAAEPGAAGDERKAALDTRANALLGRLRARKRVAAPAVDVGVRMEETRAIQEDIRARRGEPQCADTTQAAKPEAASFEAGKPLSAEDLRLRDLRRQFVSISPQTTAGKALPREFRKLEELFQGLEHTVMFGGLNENSCVVYHRVRKSVEVMAKRTFGWKELGQILAVYPESYECQRKETVHAGRKVMSVELRPRAKGAHLAMEMENRRQELRRRLVALVDAAHGEFLAARGYSNEDVAAASGWHPSFDVESTRAITPVALPPQPYGAGAGHDGAGAPVAAFDREKLKHLLGKASDRIAASTATPTVAATTTAKVPLPTPTESPVLAPAAPPPPSSSSSSSASSAPGAQKTKAQALLERIRAKQRAKEAQQQSAAPSIPASTRTMHSRLPGILEALSFMFYSERKSVLPFFYVVEKIVELKGLDKAEASGHLVALGSFVPEWCSVLTELGDVLPEGVEPAAGARVKVTRSISMQEAKSRLEAKIAELAK